MCVKHVNKNIITKNSEIYTPICAYERHVVEPILASLEEFQEHDSGMGIVRILNLVVNVNKHNPMRVGCYFEVPRSDRFPLPFSPSSTHNSLLSLHHSTSNVIYKKSDSEEQLSIRLLLLTLK